MKCPKCNRNSIMQKAYTRKKDGARCVAEYCTGGLCNYRKILKETPVPTVPAGEYKQNTKTGQLEFNL